VRVGWSCVRVRERERERVRERVRVFYVGRRRVCWGSWGIEGWLFGARVERQRCCGGYGSTQPKERLCGALVDVVGISALVDAVGISSMGFWHAM
jgi:hypothetical protein